ncbi:S100 calcium binding protein U [Nothobranchius furzeri]|nr:transcript variant X2 [Nothobranchius furzeri]KAF7211055.1 transcript variant X1 [Nothobranchius furzeri]
MEAAIQTVVKVFIKSSKGKENLGQKDFQNLVKSQLGNILSGADSKEAVKNMSQGLDSNNDGRVGFEEYMKLVGYLACSLSEQRNLENEEPEQKAATAQAAQSAPNNTGGQPKENAEAKEETKPEPKQEAKADAKVEVKAEAKAEGETKPDAVKVEAVAKAEVAAVAAPAVVAPAAEVKVAEKEPEKVEKTEKVDEAAEESPASPEEEAVEKTEEATS